MNSLSTQFKHRFIALSVIMLAACGGGSDGGTDTGGGATGTGVAACTEEKIYGQWEVTASANGLTETSIIDVKPEDGSSGKLTLNGNNFTYTDDGITLKGTINDGCNGMSGTFSGDGISGTWSAVKL